MKLIYPPILVCIFFTSVYCQDLSYDEAITACRDKKQKIEEKYPANKLFAVRPNCLYGALLPDFKVEDIIGNVITTASLRGKKNIINFWFTTCPPCIKEMPFLNRIKDELGQDDYNYLAISRDSRKDTEDFLNNHSFDFTIIPDGRSIIEDTFKHMWGYPFTIITDEDLKIVSIVRTNATEDGLRREIMEALKD